MKVFYNRKFTEEAEVQLDITNRGFNYGDGLFETIIATDKRINFLEDHLERLSAGLNEIRITLPASFTLPKLTEVIQQLRKENNLTGLSRIKIQVWRKTGGLFGPTSQEAEYLITAIATELNFKSRENVQVFDKIRLSYSPISRFKKLSSLHYIMAGIFKNESNADDVILLDTDGNLAECLASNLYWIKNNTVYTPSLETGCIEGTMQKQIKKFLLKNGIEYKEGKYKMDNLTNADTVFISNVAGINLLKKIEDNTYSAEPVWFKQLQEIWEQ